jgi:error-prone DNA polymerase
MSGYVELHARSAFSFLEGGSVPEELIAAGLDLNMQAMALLDRDGVYGAPRFHLAGKKNGIKAHIGAEVSVQSPKSKFQSPQRIYSIPVLAQTCKAGRVCGNS